MVWISVDGLEGAGKSTLVDCLKERFEAADVIHEFSLGFAGRALSQALKSDPHHVSSSAVAQSLFFLAEYREKIEEAKAAINDRRKIVISDRGTLSKYVYQKIILDPIIGSEAADALVLSSFIGLPTPNWTIYLRVAPALARMRIERRGDSRTDEQFDLMTRAAAEFERTCNRFLAVCFDSSSVCARKLCDQVHSLILDGIRI